MTTRSLTKVTPDSLEKQKSSQTTQIGQYPQYGWDFPEEFRKSSGKTPGNALRAFPGIPLESTAGMPQTLQFKAFEGSRAFPEFSPPPVRLETFFLQKWFRRGPLRAGHGIPSSAGGISDKCLARLSESFGCLPKGQNQGASETPPDLYLKMRLLKACFRGKV